MKKLLACLFFLLTIVTFNFPPVVSTEVYAQGPAWSADVRVSMFYDALLPYGNWVHHARYGWCWYPYNVPVDWRPYSNGRWVYTDNDWTWVSDYSWGWACFHYGRWFYDDTYGWLWWPDTVWAPAWVVWHTGGDWIGWAPCPPEAIWDWGVGLRFTVIDVDRFIPRHSYCFVRRKHFHDRRLRRHIALPARNVTILREARLTHRNLRSVNRRIINELPVQRQLEREVGRPLKRLRVVEADSPFRSRVAGNEVRFYRPDLREGRAVVRPERRREERSTITGRPSVGPGERPGERSTITGRPSVGSGERPDERSSIPGRPSVGPQRRPAEGPLIIPSPPRERVRPKPPELMNRQKSEMRRLEQYQSLQRRRLNAEHSVERKNPPAGIPPAQLQQQQRTERGAFQEQIKRERQTLRNWQSNEQRIRTAPGAPPRQRFSIPRTAGEGGRGRR